MPLLFDKYIGEDGKVHIRVTLELDSGVKVTRGKTKTVVSESMEAEELYAILDQLVYRAPSGE